MAWRVLRLRLSIFLTTEVTFALGFATAYGVLLEACALPSALCLLPVLSTSAPCLLAVCGDSWLQFPEAAYVGAIVGLIPATVVFLLALALRRTGVWTTMALTVGLIIAGSVLYLYPVQGLPILRLAGMGLWFASGGLGILYGVPAALRGLGESR